MAVKRSKINNLIKELKDNSMSLRKFLILYYGINIDTHGCKITHEDISVLMPQVKRVDNNVVLDNKEKIFNGDIICVLDSYNNAAFYKKTDFESIDIDSLDKIEIIKKEDKLLEGIILNENLSLYELVTLCRKYKNANMIREYRICYSLLKKKKSKEKGEKHNKRKVKLRKEDYYD